MLKLIRLAQAALSDQERCVLCSVVRLEGSGYGRVGARLLMTESGDHEGFISGGCLEKELCRRVFMEAAHSAKHISFDTRSTPLSASKYNAGCDGVVHVLCQPLVTTDTFFYRVATKVIQQRCPARMLTVYRSQWADVSVGDSLAHFGDSSYDGTSATVSSDDDLFQRLLRAIPGTFTAEVTDSEGRALELVVETMQPPRRLVIFGAGDDVQPVTAAALNLGWEVCVVGKRPELLTPSRFPGAQVFAGELTTLARQLVPDEFTHAILMTHDMESDLQLLPILANAPLRSLGMLGSKRRLAKLVAELYRRGDMFSADELDRIRSPIGLDIGAETPEEIALSITSELVAIDRHKEGAKLTELKAPVHAHIPHHFFKLNTNGRARDDVSARMDRRIGNVFDTEATDLCPVPLHQQ